jgi:hypothetical protein
MFGIDGDRDAARSLVGTNGAQPFQRLVAGLIQISQQKLRSAPRAFAWEIFGGSEADRVAGANKRISERPRRRRFSPNDQDFGHVPSSGIDLSAK